jgi:hypothetical protein
MPSQTDYLTPRRRVILSWTLIFVALLCQITREVSIANIFILFAAGAFHEILLGRTQPRLDGPVVKIAILAVFLIFFLGAFLHLFAMTKIIYALYPIIAVFLVWGFVSDLKYLRSQRVNEEESNRDLPVS